MKIHIAGASGSGTTTLGKLLSAETNIPYFDTDDYFWESTELPYSVRRNPEERNSKIISDLNAQTNWILGGSIIPWGEALEPLFDLVVFLWIPHELRIRRLKQREYERYGDVIFQDEGRHLRFENFIAWASQYDDETAPGRTLAAHEKWMRTLSCPVLELRGDYTFDERMNAIGREIKRIGYYPELDMLLP